MLCVSVALVVACVVGAVLALGCGVLGSWWCSCVCLVCGRRWLCVGEVPLWWVWLPPWVLGVWLVLVLAAGGVAVRRCCCGTLLCFALLYLCAAACCCVVVSFIVPLPALACSAALCAMLPPRCALRCLHEARRPLLPGQGHSSRGGRVRVTSEALGQGRPPIGGAESEPPGLAIDSCARAPFVGGGGCAWVQCPCSGSSPHTGRWVLGWRWCLRRVVWLSAAIIVVHCFALFCCTVCCVLSCAGKFRYMSLPALRCCAALCAALPPGGVAAAATQVPPPPHSTCTVWGCLLSFPRDFWVLGSWENVQVTVPPPTPLPCGTPRGRSSTCE